MKEKTMETIANVAKFVIVSMAIGGIYRFGQNDGVARTLERLGDWNPTVHNEFIKHINDTKFSIET